MGDHFSGSLFSAPRMALSNQAAARRNDQRVYVVTATKGEAGTWDEERWPTPKMGEIRDAELMRCLQQRPRRPL